ncbi:MAG: zinc ribbon domain-containing protein [Patescibacteria group bacterium]
MFFIICGIRPVVKREGTDGRGFCPVCGDLRNLERITARSYFTLFFVPVFPVGRPETGYACNCCGNPVRPGAAEPARAPLAPGESLILQCPRCDGRMRAPLREQGYTAVCPHCAMAFRVMGQREEAPEAEVRD